MHRVGNVGLVPGRAEAYGATEPFDTQVVAEQSPIEGPCHV